MKRYVAGMPAAKAPSREFKRHAVDPDLVANRRLQLRFGDRRPALCGVKVLVETVEIEGKKYLAPWKKDVPNACQRCIAMARYLEGEGRTTSLRGAMAYKSEKDG